MKPTPLPWTALALHLVLSAGPVRAQHQPTRSRPTGQSVEEALQRFRSLSAARQDDLLESVRAEVEAIDDPYLGSLRVLVARNAVVRKELAAINERS